MPRRLKRKKKLAKLRKRDAGKEKRSEKLVLQLKNLRLKRRR